MKIFQLRTKTTLLFLGATAFLAAAGYVQTTYTLYAFTNFAGLPGGSGNVDGVGSTARFSFFLVGGGSFEVWASVGIAVDGRGNAYLADTGNSTIRKITSGGVVTTLAGSPGQSGSQDGPGGVARFKFPFGLAVDTNDNVYVADTINFTIRKITSSGLVTTWLALPGRAAALMTREAMPVLTSLRVWRWTVSVMCMSRTRTTK